MNNWGWQIFAFVLMILLCLACEAAGWHVKTSDLPGHALRGGIAWLAAVAVVLIAQHIYYTKM